MSTPDQLSDPDLLHGWKEIAAHLRRAPRTAQRWEAKLGLPVHRIRTPDGGEIVYASRGAIDAWRQRAERQSPDPGDVTHDAGRPDPAGPSSLRRPGRAREDAGYPPRERAAAVAAAVRIRDHLGIVVGVVAGVLIGLSISWGACDPQGLALVQVDGREIRALGQRERMHWRRDLCRHTSFAEGPTVETDDGQGVTAVGWLDASLVFESLKRGDCHGGVQRALDAQGGAVCDRRVVLRGACSRIAR